MSVNDDFSAIFETFKGILKKYEKHSIVEKDSETDYYLNTRKLYNKKKPIFFAATSINKISVSFYLMPIYCCPGLLDGMSPGLRKHLHGKSCFRFSKAEPALFKELSALTKKCVEWYKDQAMM